MKLNELQPGVGATHRVKRLGRGDATGHGGTSTRGHKGQKSRSGGYHKRGFEGGQMPLQRRIPKQGFTNIFKRVVTVVNVEKLNSLPKGTEVTQELLLEKGVINKKGDFLKILGDGKVGNALTIKGALVSKQAKAEIEAAGGKIVS